MKTRGSERWHPVEANWHTDGLDEDQRSDVSNMSAADVGGHDNMMSADYCECYNRVRPTTAFTHTLLLQRGTEKWWWEIRPLNRGEEGKKVEPVQTDFTDDVISESNAANERA